MLQMCGTAPFKKDIYRDNSSARKHGRGLQWCGCAATVNIKYEHGNPVWGLSKCQDAAWWLPFSAVPMQQSHWNEWVAGKMNAALHTAQWWDWGLFQLTPQMEDPLVMIHVAKCKAVDLGKLSAIWTADDGVFECKPTFMPLPPKKENCIVTG